MQLELFRVSDWLFAASLNMEFSMQTYFDQLDRVRYEGPKSTNPLAFRHYNPDEL
ncbi:xylose isomerase, partial [Klebsiella pneumoniae]|nr:xylose isomerase [Klebsiella pneumoniae]